MKGLLLFSAIMVMSVRGFSQKSYEVLKDEENGQVVFKGTISYGDLRNEKSFEWFKKSDSYQPHTEAIQYLQKHMPSYDMVVVMGTWCEDSQNLVPKLYKVLQLADYPMSRYRMFGVDRSKNAEHDEKKQYKIELVPTIILYKDGREAGRIVETVKKSVEDDLLAMIAAQEHK